MDEVLKKFYNKYNNISKIIENNIENLTDQQKERLIEDLERITANIKENNSCYRSDFKNLQMILKDLQFYEFLESNNI